MKPPSVALANLTGRDYEEALLVYLRELFGFLSDTYGFVEVPSIAVEELRLENTSTLVIIRSEWEGPWVAFDHASKPKNPQDGSLPLWIIMAIRNSKYGVSLPEPMIDKFLRYANAIPECAGDVLRGDFTIESDVIRYSAQLAEDRREWERKLHLESVLSRANEAFRNKNYKAVIECLTPLQSELSEAQAAKLAYAERKVAST
jgi:hypothetical protein